MAPVLPYRVKFIESRLLLTPLLPPRYRHGVIAVPYWMTFIVSYFLPAARESSARASASLAHSLLSPLPRSSRFVEAVSPMPVSQRLPLAGPLALPSDGVCIFSSPRYSAATTGYRRRSGA